KMGAAKILGFFIGSAIGSYYSIPLGKECEPVIRSLLQQDGIISQWASQAAVVAGCAFLTVLTLHICVTIFSAACPSLQIANQRFGFLLGSVQGVGTAILFLCGLLAIEPIAAKRLQVNANPN